jgi:cell division protein FtsW
VKPHSTSVYLLIGAVLALITLGLVMMSSTSAFAPESHGDAMFLLKRQVVWLGVGLLLGAIASMVDYHHLHRFSWIAYVLAAILLLLCFVPHIGHSHYGAKRWIKLGMSFQPSEFAKLAAVSVIAWFLSHKSLQSRPFFYGFFAPLLAAGILMALIAAEVDLGTTALIGGTTLLLLFIAGTRLRYLVPTVLLGVTLLGGVIWKMPERSGRFLAFLYPEKYVADAYQAEQGLIALGSGGMEGLGLGNGRQKMLYLPFAHTDFIFPVMGEELGLRCTLAVVAIFLTFILAGSYIAVKARDRFGLLLGVGVTFLIGLQAVVNIGVTTAVLPNKGMPMPFISYGGTNLVFCLIGVGILVNIYKQGINERDEKRALSTLSAYTKKGRRIIRL